MALAKDPTSHDHSRIGSIQAFSLHDHFPQVSDPSCHGIFRFDHEHHHQTTMNTKGYVFEATNYQPEEAHASLINFNPANGHDTFVHSSPGSNHLLSFVQNESPPDQETYSKTSDHDQHEYSSLWENFGPSNVRLLENFNSYQTASSDYGSMMSNIINSTAREKQHGDQEIFGFFFNEATATINSNNIPGTHVAASCNKRPADMGESMQALKKQCTGAITKKPKPKTVSSKDPQSIAAKNRRERISERLKVLQELVPNGTKVDLVTMLEKAISYVKFLQLQVKVLATDDFWPAQGGKAPDISQVKEAIDAILSTQKDRN